jgi:hypothetical protein
MVQVIDSAFDNDAFMNAMNIYFDQKTEVNQYNVTDAFCRVVGHTQGMIMNLKVNLPVDDVRRLAYDKKLKALELAWNVYQSNAH